jgi:RNA polymerase sigma factor (sigma-70 family)
MLGGEAARDAVQDGFVRAIRDRASYRGDGPLEAWIWRCVIRAVLTDARRRHRGEELEQRLARPAAAEPRAAPGAVHALVGGLPERQRVVLFLRYYADLDYATIAEALEISVGTVGASLHAAHRSLRQAMEEAPT